MNTIAVTDLFAAAYCMTQGVNVVSVRPGPFVRIELDSRAGKCLDEWYGGQPMVNGHKLAQCYRTVMNMVRANKTRD